VGKWPRQEGHMNEVITAFKCLLQKYQAPAPEKNKAKKQAKRYQSLVRIFCYLCCNNPQALLDSTILNKLPPNLTYQDITAHPKTNPMRVAFDMVKQQYQIHGSLSPALLIIIEQLASQCWWRQFENKPELVTSLTPLPPEIQGQVYNAYHKGKNQYTQAYHALRPKNEIQKSILSFQLIAFMQGILLQLIPRDLILVVVSYCHFDNNSLASFLNDTRYSNIFIKISSL
jgi:hypothetical protein